MSRRSAAFALRGVESPDFRGEPRNEPIMPRPLRRFRRRRFLGSRWPFACPASPFPSLAAEEPVSLPFEFDPARDPAQDLDVALRIARAAGPPRDRRRRRRMVLVVPHPGPVLHRQSPISSATATRTTCGSRSTGRRKTTTTRSSRYPAIKGYPHLFVLDANGRLLHSQDTDELETTKNYDPAAMRAFLVKWAPR